MRNIRNDQSIRDDRGIQNDRGIQSNRVMWGIRDIRKYGATMRLILLQGFEGGVPAVLGRYGLRLLSLAAYLMIWRSLFSGGAEHAGMTLEQIMSYTLISSLLSPQLRVVTPVATLFWEGDLAIRYTRPLPLTAQIVAETVAGWGGDALLFVLPMLLAAPLLGVRALPAGGGAALWFGASFVLSVSLGFAVDFIFSAFATMIRNANWTIYSLRMTVTTFLSGAVIPFALLPWGLGAAFELLPFGSLAAAPLSLYVGLGEGPRTVLLQLFWNAALWPPALRMMRRARERMVSYGG